VSWEGLAKRIAAILVLGVFLLWVGSAYYWHPSLHSEHVMPCGPHGVCTSSGRVLPTFIAPHPVVVAVFGTIWAITAIFLVRNWIRPTSGHPAEIYP
jgi:hypothetical protein